MANLYFFLRIKKKAKRDIKVKKRPGGIKKTEINFLNRNISSF
jgi:hypothetical protein